MPFLRNEKGHLAVYSMQYFSQKIIRLRTIVVLIVAVLVSLSILTFFNYIKTPTDENLFRDIPSNLVIKKSFPAGLQSKKPFLGERIQDGSTNDSLLAGDLVLAMNDGQVTTIKDAEEIVDHFPASAEIKFTVLRPSGNNVLEMRAAIKNIPKDFLELLSSYVYVSDVTPNGASDRAGMKVGDLIISVNDQTFSNAAEADLILRKGQIGKAITYKIVRTNETKILHVTLAKFGVQNGTLLFTMSGLGMLFIGAFIWYARPLLKPARMLGISFIAIGYFLSVLIIRREIDSTIFTVIRNFIEGVAYFIGPAMMVHAFHYFPKERQELISRKWIARTYYLLSAISTVTAVLLNRFDAVFLFFLFIIFIAIRYRKSASKEYKEILRIIKFVSLGVGIFSVIITVLSSSAQDPIGIGIVGVLILLIPLSFLYTIMRYHLLDIYFRVRRNIQYSILSFFWSSAIIYFLLSAFLKISEISMPKFDIIFTGASIEISDTINTVGNKISAEHFLLIFGSVTVTFLLIQIRRQGQKFIDRKYYRTQYDYRKTSQEFNELLATTHSIDQLAKDFVVKLAALIHLKKAGVLFFRDEEQCVCNEVYGFNGTEWKQFCLTEEKNIISAMKQIQNELRADYLPETIKYFFQRENFQYVIPIRSKDRLLGVMLIGEKRAETTFRHEDLSLLSSVAKQASVAIENAFLYEDLAEQERMKHELEIARRIQIDSLPQKTPNIPGLEISGVSIPALEVGGDFFDYLTNDALKITIIIGDVSGKGTSAALYMSKVQGIFRSLYEFNLTPNELFRRANSLLCKDLEKRSFITALGAEFHPAEHKITVSRAGHLPLFYFNHSEQKVKKILPRGMGMGLNDEGIFASELEEYQRQYQSGDIFLFATDGVTEAQENTYTEFGEERLQLVLQKNSSSTADEIKEQILSEIKVFVQNLPQHDDQTIVVVKITS